MTIKITTSNSPTQIENVTVSDNVTVVKKVVVGRPIRRVNPVVETTIDNLSGVNTSNKADGSVLVYNVFTGDWEATLELEKQTINGGQY